MDLEKRRKIMRRIRLKDYGELEFRSDWEGIPEVTKGTLKVKVSACGICGSDIALYRGQRDLTKELYFGHEFAGTVMEIGEDTAPIEVGTRIATELSQTCGHCWNCTRGLPNYCRSMNDALIPGGFAEETLVRHQEDYSFLSPIPDELDDVTASLAEPFNCAYHIARQAELHPGDSVLIIGMGTIGILTGIILKHFGAGQVIGADTNPYRLKTIEKMGLFDVVNSSEAGWLEQVREMGGEKGTDIVVEATGVVQVLKNAFDAVRPGGKIVVGGVYNAPANGLDLLPIFRKELAMVGAKGPFPYIGYDGRSIPMKTLIRLKDDVGKIVTVYDYAAANQAFEDMMSGKSIKSVIRF
jgi:threonine dehydrogenase-like Zn-dependent dehydrogenase